MPFIPVDTSGVVESKPVPAGMYDTVITECDGAAVSKNGLPQMVVTIGIEGHEDAAPLRHYVSLPQQNDEPQKLKGKVLFLRRFVDLYGVKLDPSGFDSDKVAMELVGKRAKAEISLTEPDDSGNVYNRLITPRLKDDSQPAAKATPKPPKR